MWTGEKIQLTIPIGEVRNAWTNDIATLVGVPSPTLVRTRGFLTVFNVDINQFAPWFAAILFTNSAIATGVDQTANF